MAPGNRRICRAATGHRRFGPPTAVGLRDAVYRQWEIARWLDAQPSGELLIRDTCAYHRLAGSRPSEDLAPKALDIHIQGITSRPTGRQVVWLSFSHQGELIEPPFDISETWEYRRDVWTNVTCDYVLGSLPPLVWIEPDANSPVITVDGD